MPMKRPSREARNDGMAKVMADPAMQAADNLMPFDGQRIIFGGFDMIMEA